MSTSTPTERDQQSFAETALRLGGKTEEEARRTGAVDKADEQVEALFKPQYQTVNSPIHKAVWDGKVPLDLFAPPPLAAVAPVRQGDGGVAGRRPPPPRGRHAARREGQGSRRRCCASWATPATGACSSTRSTAARARRSRASRTS